MSTTFNRETADRLGDPDVDDAGVRLARPHGRSERNTQSKHCRHGERARDRTRQGAHHLQGVHGGAPAPRCCADSPTGGSSSSASVCSVATSSAQRSPRFSGADQNARIDVIRRSSSNVITSMPSITGADSPGDDGQPRQERRLVAVDVHRQEFDCAVLLFDAVVQLADGVVAVAHTAADRVLDRGIRRCRARPAHRRYPIASSSM